MTWAQGAVIAARGLPRYRRDRLRGRRRTVAPSLPLLATQGWEAAAALGTGAPPLLRSASPNSLAYCCTSS